MFRWNSDHSLAHLSRLEANCPHPSSSHPFIPRQTFSPNMPLWSVHPFSMQQNCVLPPLRTRLFVHFPTPFPLLFRFFLVGLPLRPTVRSTLKEDDFLRSPLLSFGLFKSLTPSPRLILYSGCFFLNPPLMIPSSSPNSSNLLGPHRSFFAMPVAWSSQCKTNPVSPLKAGNV